MASPPAYISRIVLLLLLSLRGSLSIRRFHWTSFSRPFATASWQRQQHSFWKDASPRKSSLIPRSFLQLSRGGSQEQYNDSASTTATTTATASASAGSNDEERYSRQVYTLGARAHGLVRSSTIYIDGPASSGLVYEIVKDLALSGVGTIILCCRSTDSLLDDQYHDASLDDLGNAYRRAAQEELKTTKNNNDDPNDDGDNLKPPEEQILAEYIRRLNPSVHVSHMERPKEFTRKDGDSFLSNHCDSRRVLVSVDRPYRTQVNLNQLARNHDMAFVAVETAGVYGRVFCDFGPEFQVHDTDGETPLVTPLDRLEVISQEDKDHTDGGVMALHCIDSEKHDVSKGDKIQFQMSNGAMMAQKGTVVKVLTPHKVLVEVDDDDDPLSETSATRESISSDRTLQAFTNLVNQRASSFSRVKIPTNVPFLPLDEVMQIFYDNGGGELFTPCDLDKSFDETRRTTIMSCFQALFSYVERRQCLPTKVDLKDFLQQQALSSQNNCGSEWTTEQSTHIQNFVGCCAAKFTPIQAMFGAIAAQEALKAATGLYNPVKQILIYDCDELLDEQKKDESADASSLSSKSKKKATGLAYILGTSLETKVKSSKLFVVGAGAIGCELLKNLASMGFGTGKKGCISLTDMDTIEKSNLSRQLLFRDSNIGEFKSIAAQNAIHRFNPSTRVDVYTSKVGEESSGPFNENFWSSGVDVVLNALDNTEARLFMDQQCVSNEKALIDAGTLGSKGNVQVVVPHQSESYGSSIDPPEPAIPVCTLKNFPYAIAHTIQWGRDLFDGLYQRRPRQANDVAPSLASHVGTAATLAQRLIQEMGEAAAIAAAKELAEDINFAASQDRSAVRKVSIEWAVGLATRLFHDTIQDLLREHPADSLDEDGEPFWTGSRKVPTPLLYVPSASETDAAAVAANLNLVEFVRSAGRLRMEMLLGIDSQSAVSAEEAKQALEDLQGNKDNLCQQGDEDDAAEAKVQVIGQLESLPDGSPTFLHNVEFEKDDDSNGHVQFVNAASNLRAICYGIPPVNAMETRRVAGKIVPAMITTTAVVSALSCVELLKLLQVAPLTSHRNAFFNLAIPFFAFTVPVPVDEMPGPDGKMFSVWDSIVIKEKKKSEESKGLTLKRLIKKLKKAISGTPENIKVSSVSIGPYMIYASFLHEGDKTTLSKTIWELVEDAKSDEIDEDFAARSADLSSPAGDKTGDENKLELSVTVEDSISGEEFLLPPVRVYRSLDKQSDSNLAT